MDDVVPRPRYPRHSVPNRRKKRYTREGSSLFEKIIRQTVLAVVILVCIGVVKSINTPVTNFMTDKLRTALFHNIELKSIYQNINGFVDDLKNSKKSSGNEDISGEPVVPANSNAVNGAETNSISPGTNQFTAQEEADAGQVYTDKITKSIKEAFSFIIPVDGLVTSSYGVKTHATKRTSEFHKGVDIEAEKGASIIASLAGEVVESGTDITYGKYIRLKHEDGISTVYAHCSQLLAEKGSKIKQGDMIAKVGDSDLSVGSHLHFEIWKDGTPLNPLNFIEISTEP